jgi:hypothetical protein
MSPLSPFTRDGHLHDLALHQVVTDALPIEGEVAAHLAGCPPCQDRLAAAQAAAAEPLPPLRLAAVAPVPAARPAANRLPTWAVGLASLAAALLLSWTLWPAPPIDAEPAEVMRPRGAALSLEVYKQEGETARRLGDGDTVQAGDRLGFRVRHAEGGHLLVLGRDQAGQIYPAWPAGPAPDAAVVGPAAEAVTLDVAVQIDAQPGEERLTALLCAGPLRWEQARGHLASGGPAPAGCVEDSLRLSKPAAP